MQLSLKVAAFSSVLLMFADPALAQLPPKLTFTGAVGSDTWEQLGSDIDGEAAFDSSGGSVSLSADGLSVAIGATSNDGNGRDSGQVRIYRFSGVKAEWEQFGADIDGEVAGDQSGLPVSLSADGLTVAIGARRNDVTGSSFRQSRIYRYDEASSQWEQLGAVIDSEAVSDSAGFSLSLSADGQTIAIGYPPRNGAGRSGKACIYRYDEGSAQWEQLGEDIDGEVIGDRLGASVSLSEDGQTIAIGAPGNEGNGTNSEHTEIYHYNEVSAQWEQLGSDIDAEADFDRSGEAVTMSSDGLNVAIGAPGNDGNGSSSGHTRFFRYDNSTTQWEQLGADIDGEAVFDGSGESVSLSADGFTAAIGTSKNDGNGDSSGHARIYQYNGAVSQWEQLGADIDGEDIFDRSGGSVSLSADGLTVAIGAPGNDGSQNGSGHARIYRFSSIRTYEVLENTTSITDVMAGDDVDTEGAGLIYGLSGVDAASFTINATGELAFVSAPDYEIAADAGADNVYDLIVTVRDSEGLSDSQEVVVTVIDVNDFPALAGVNDLNFDGNGSGSLDFILSGSDDLGSLSISAVSDNQALVSNSSLIFTGVGGDRSLAINPVTAQVGVAIITVTLSDGVNNLMETFVVTVTNQAPELSFTDGTFMTQWDQFGIDIDGEAAGDESGRSVSLSGDGLTAAIGAPRNDGNGDGSGQTRIYRYDEITTQWEQLGADIDGETAGDGAGGSVSLNADGFIVAIGEPNNAGNGDFSGHTRMYRFDENTTEWNQLGADLDGEAVGDFSGFSVSLSADGLTAAIGAIGNDGNGDGSGHTRIYRYDEITTQWGQLGSDIDGEAGADQSGRAVSLSGDGLTVAIGAPENDGNGNSSGHVRIFRYDDISSEWIQLGADLDGEASGDRSGESISLSANGLTVAIGAPGNSASDAGYSQIYRYNEEATQWEQLGADLDGEASSDNSGGSVSLSAEGFTVVVGAPGNAGNGTDSGHARIYRLTTTPTDTTQADGTQIYAILEGTTFVTDVITSDDIDAEGSGLDFDLSGVDAAFFMISAIGELAFVSAPVLEAPADAGSDNIYDLIVTVTDSGGLSSIVALTIVVTDVIDAPLVISDNDFDISGQTVSLSWNSFPGESYLIRYSPDLVSWDAVVEAGVTSAQDENPGDARELTVTFDLSGVFPAGVTKGFFRVEEE